MAMTMTQKILAKSAGLKSVEAGDLIISKLDLVMANDITAPPAIWEFEKIGKQKVFDKSKVALVPDHFTPNKDIKSAQMCKVTRDFARSQQIEHYFEVGRVGIEHALLPEKGLVAPGEVIIGGDSHTCTYGAVNAFSTGVGQTDIGAAFASGDTWLKVPPAIKVVLKGKLPKYVKGKDIVLTLIGKIGVDGARYQSLEFFGDIAELTMDDRFTICNMAIEAGAKNGIFPCDEVTKEYLKDKVTRDYTCFEADTDAVYEQTVEIELDKMKPVVAHPHLPENVFSVDESKNIKVDQVIIGSCTNGRLSDLAQAAEVLKGKKVHDDVRVIVFPATQKIYLQAIELGYIKTFIDAGVAVSTPTCGPCLGGHMGILAEGEIAIATTNRNFKGRMGHIDSKIYLASPYTAAASAILGRIASPEEVM